MYTTCEPIHCRAIVPLQDTPSIKSTYQAIITVPQPYRVNMSANCTSQVDNLNDKTSLFTFSNKIPVPSYLLAIAVGNLVTQQIDSRTYVISIKFRTIIIIFAVIIFTVLFNTLNKINYISEPDTIKDYAEVLSEMGSILNMTEKYVNIPYIWGIYAILVLPPSYYSGAMENPLLTFAAPTMMVKDKSQVYGATHELVHSWTGNMVTCRDWSNLWLNEGFTTFIETKISAQQHGEDLYL